ncbi:TolC family protein [Taibaiella sp. KBW10]|uniref:TolC family protein n=1 Tax=Taibaiella sp. KBW10 TaxID=2153357 RepID=UPI000F5A4C89|nr:TolC family protein [Taibaiella sp. KBW10]RQO31422.1 TolC family protein [Taibaiella sp. KBW10]
MKKKIFSYLVFSILSIQGIQAQLQLPESLQEAIQAALHNSTEITNQGLEIEKLELERKSVWNKYIPKVEASALYSYLNNELTLDIPATTLPLSGTTLFDGKQTFSNQGQVFYGGITAKAVLFSGGQIYNGAKAIEAKTKGTAYLLEPKKDEVIKDVIHSFDHIRLLNEAEQLLQESEKRLNKETERVEKAIALGLAIPYDRDKIKLAALELASKKVEISGKRKVLYQKINDLTGYDDVQIDAVNYELYPITVAEEAALNTENRAEAKALSSFKDAYSYALKKEKGSLLPTLGAFGSYSYASLFNGQATGNIPLGNIGGTAYNYNLNLQLNQATLSPNWMVGLAFKWEIFSGFERKHKIEEARINITQIENKLADTKHKMNLQLQNNKARYETSLQQIALAEQRQKIASNNLTMAEKQYKAGLINITERLTAETDIYQASLNKINVLIEERLAALETYAATGTLQSSLQTK